MTAPALAGVYCPIATPFAAATGELAERELRANLARLAADGLAGVLVSGSTGEAPLLDLDEVRRLSAVARAALPADRAVLAGAGAESTRQAVALARAAGGAGADAVLVRPPAYYGAAHSAASMLAHFRAVADASPVPVLVYNIPKYTRWPVPPDLLAALAEHEHVIGVKDSSGDLENLAAYRAAVPGWVVLVGSGSLLLPALERGCEGGICAVSCYAARDCAALVAAFRRGDRAAAAALQEKIGPLDRQIVGALGPAGIKAAMDAVGLYGGPVRPPLAPLPDAERERVRRLVAA